jgi:hypothetical protein
LESDSDIEAKIEIFYILEKLNPQSARVRSVLEEYLRKPSFNPKINAAAMMALIRIDPENEILSDYIVKQLRHLKLLNLGDFFENLRQIKTTEPRVWEALLKAFQNFIDNPRQGGLYVIFSSTIKQMSGVFAPGSPEAEAIKKILEPRSIRDPYHPFSLEADALRRDTQDAIQLFSEKITPPHSKASCLSQALLQILNEMY